MAAPHYRGWKRAAAALAKPYKTARPTVGAREAKTSVFAGRTRNRRPRDAEWVCLGNLVSATHPSLRTNFAKPVRHTRHNTAAVLLYVAFRDVPHRDFATGTVGDRPAEHALALEHSL